MILNHSVLFYSVHHVQDQIILLIRVLIVSLVQPLVALVQPLVALVQALVAMVQALVAMVQALVALVQAHPPL